MKTAIEILKALEQKGIQIVVNENHNLTIRGDKSSIDADLIDAIRSNKDLIVSFLRKLNRPEAIERIARTGKPVAASFAQQRLWMLDKLDGQSAHYHIPGLIEMKGALFVPALEQALLSILQRHESLRTCFVENESGEPRQTVRDAKGFAIQQFDVSTLADDVRQEEIRRLIALEIQRPFNLRCDLMLRASLVRRTTDEYILLVVMHHIAADGWSLSILINEVSALYSAYIQGQANPLPALEIQYIDYALWQRNWLQGEVLERKWHYWETQLLDLPEAHSLPLDYPRPAVQTFRGATLRRQIGSPARDRLLDFCRNQGATLFMGLHAAFSVLLSRYSNESDIVVGSPIANREQEEVANLIGLFVNILVLRSDLSDNPDFITLLHRSKQLLLDASAHQQVPFEYIVERLQPERNLSHSPLFQIMLVLQNNEKGILELPNLEIRSISGADDTVAKYDLTLNVTETQAGLSLEWEYNRDLFHEASILRMAGHFEILLNALLDAPTENVFKVNMFNKTEHHQLLTEWNDTCVDYPRDACIHELIEARATDSPEAVAVVFENQQLTYGELNVRANRLAHYLIEEKQIEPDTLIGVYIERSLDLIIAILGILKAGAAYVPLDPTYPAARLEYMLTDANLCTVITHRKLLATMPINQALCLDDEELKKLLEKKSGHNPPSGKVSPDNLAYVIYTSGSTGRPKGVLLEHRGLVNLAIAQASGFRVRPGDRMLQFASIAFDAAVSEIMVALISGAELILLRDETVKSPQEVSNVVKRHLVTHATLPPALLPVLNPEDWLSVTTMVIAGEACSRKQAEIWSKGRVFINAYGPSESTVCATMGIFRKEDACLHMGRPIQNVVAYVMNSAGQLCPVGTAGELHIGGAGLARAYLNQPALTREKFISNPFFDKSNPYSSRRLYKTGDRVRWTAEGYLEFLGRLDDQIKIRGFRVELGEIANTLRNIEGVRDALVLARADTQGGRQLAAYVVAPDAGVSHQVLTDRLRSHLRRNLPEQLIPAAFAILEALPLTPNGKIDRKALPAPDVTLQQAGYTPPATDTEKLLCTVWADVLKVKRVGTHDNFFHLGGHSLLAVAVISKLQQNGFSLTAQQFFSSPTVAEQANALTRSSPPDRFIAPVNRIPENCARLTPAMLPLVKLSEEELDRIIARVPGGAPNIQDIYPLAPVQEGILFHHMMNNEQDPYVLSMLLRFDNTKAGESFIAGLQNVIDRHDALRTAVLWDNLTVPVQVVYRRASLRIESVPPIAGTDVRQQMRQLCSQAVAIDLQQAPLVCLTVAPDPDTGECFVLCRCHHIIADHVGLYTIVREVLAYQKHGLTRLAPPSSYRDFIAYVQQQSPEEAQAYFQSMLGDVEESTAPFNLRDVRGDGQDIEEVIQPVAEQTATAIRTLARQLNVSPATLFHVAWAKVISACSAREDVVFGTVLSGRLQAVKNIEDMLGAFINTLPIRIRLEEQSIQDVVRQVHQRLVELPPYEQIPLTLAQRCSPLPKDVPLFSAILNYRHGIGMHEASLSASLGVEVLMAHERTNYPLCLCVDDLEDGNFSLTVQAAASIGAQRIAVYMQTALARLVLHLQSSPEMKIRRLEILPNTERHQLLAQWNATAQSYPRDKCIHELFEARVATSPDAPALVYEEQMLSYLELNKRANRLARYLLEEHRLNPDGLVGICLERSIEMVVAILAIQKAGGAYVPLDPDYPTARLAYMLEDAEVSTVLTQGCLRERLPLHGIPVIELDDVRFQAGLNDYTTDNLSAADLGLTPQNLAYVIYTSGSTGQPKGVMIEHRSLVNRIVWMDRCYGASPSDRILQKTPFSFDVSVWEFFWPLTAGAVLVMAPPGVHKNPLALSKVIQAQRITKLHFVPSMLGSMLTLGDLSNCESLRQVFCSGEALPLHCVEQFYDRCHCATLHNLYGPTEAAIDVSYWRCSDKEATHESVPIGRPIANTQLYVLDSHGKLLPPGVAGELYIGGVGLARGYLNRPALTQERFIPNPFYDARDPASSTRLYKTGDLARWLSGGNLLFLGRLDHQVKLRGFRIELGEIENALLSLDQVREAVAVARAEAPDRQQLVAYVVASEQIEPQVSTENLRARLCESLPEYMVPAAFVMLNALPLTPSGKIDRKALPTPDFAEQQHLYVPPATETEKLLCTIWADVLKVERVGIHDNFFHLGGDSLLVIKLMSRMNEKGHRYPLKTIMENPTISKISAIGSESLQSRNESHQSPLSGLIPLTMSQKWLLNSGLYSNSQWLGIWIFDVSAGSIDFDFLKMAIIAIQNMHDALRATFVKKNGEWLANIEPEFSDIALPQIDLSNESSLTDANYRLTEYVKSLRKRLDIFAGPTFIVAHASMPEGVPDKICMLAHHLVYDLYSLDVIQSDFTRLYHSYCDTRNLTVNRPPSSIKDVAEWANNEEESQKLFGEVKKWLSDFSIQPIPKDFDASDEENLVSSTDAVNRSIELPARDRRTSISIVDYCYISLINAIAHFSGSDSIQFISVSAIRNDISLATGLDLSRTVGYINSAKIIVLNKFSGSTALDRLNSLHHQLNNIPYGGLFNRDIQEYKNRDGKPLVTNEIKFNYLGSGLSEPQESLLKFDEALSKSFISREVVDGIRDGLLFIYAGTQKGRLEIRFEYSTNFHKKSTLESIADRFIEEFDWLIGH